MNIILNFWNKHIWTITFVICLPLILAFISQKVYGSNSDIGEQRVCLAQNIYFESANQPDAGRVAVAQVVLNRVDDCVIFNSLSIKEINKIVTVGIKSPISQTLNFKLKTVLLNEKH